VHPATLMEQTSFNGSPQVWWGWEKENRTTRVGVFLLAPCKLLVHAA